jgi:hypothetical protein
MSKETNKPLSVITEKNGRVRNATCADCFHFREGSECRTKFEKTASDKTCHYAPSRYCGPGKHEVNQDGMDMSMKYFVL